MVSYLLRVPLFASNYYDICTICIYQSFLRNRPITGDTIFHPAEEDEYVRVCGSHGGKVVSLLRRYPNTEASTHSFMLPNL